MRHIMNSLSMMYVMINDVSDGGEFPAKTKPTRLNEIFSLEELHQPDIFSDIECTWACELKSTAKHGKLRQSTAKRRAIMNGAGTAPCDGRRHVSFAVVCRSLPCFAVLFSSQAHVHSMSEKMSGWCWGVGSGGYNILL